MGKQDFDLNIKLQKKKNSLRKELSDMGVIKEDKKNNFDNYTFLSNNGYKKLFTGLFSKHGLEISTTVIECEAFDTYLPKQPNGRRVKLKIKLTDIDTGFYEESISIGEGIDRGDKAIYKARTGAIKYYLADTFLVATGEEPENDSDDIALKLQSKAKQTPKQKAWLEKLTAEEKKVAMQLYKVKKLEDLTEGQVWQLYLNIKESKGDKKWKQ